MNINIDGRSRVPIYEQIKEQIMLLIQLGVLKPHQQLPSVRSLAVELGLNVNTIRRAFVDLESAGIVYSVPGKGSYVMENAFANSIIKEKALAGIKTAVFSGKAKGVSIDETMQLIKEIYSEEGNS